MCMIILGHNTLVTRCFVPISIHIASVRNIIIAVCYCGSKKLNHVWNVDILAWGNVIAHGNVDV